MSLQSSRNKSGCSNEDKTYPHFFCDVIARKGLSGIPVRMKEPAPRHERRGVPYPKNAKPLKTETQNNNAGARGLRPLPLTLAKKAPVQPQQFPGAEGCDTSGNRINRKPI
jgi:hypothetical protein